MAYKTNAVIIAELEVLNVGYDDDMTNAELQALLDEATDAPDEQPKAKPAAQAEEVNLGVSTINDHEKRVFALEQTISALVHRISALEHPTE